MTAFTINSGGDEYFDAKTGGSVNATLDTYTISAGSRLIVRTDTYACPNHGTTFGSLDTVSYSGIGGTLHFDPTYVRIIPYDTGTGNVPATGTTITQGGTTAILLGVWSGWQVDNTASGSAMPASGYIKVGGVTGGSFTTGALSGISANATGADVQGWIEVRGADTATITVPRIGSVTSVEAWFELGTTNGTRGQVIPCPTTATNAGVFPAVWIETSAGSGVYEPYDMVHTAASTSAWRTTEDVKVFWQTTSGIRIGNDGTNNIGYLPPTGCKVRIPATIWTTCTRTAGSGSGPRVLPNATMATRQEFVTTSAGYFDIQGVISQWYMNFTQPFYVKLKSCGISGALVLSEVSSALDIDNTVVSSTQAQIIVALQITSCFAGGTIQNAVFSRYSLASSGSYSATINYVDGITFYNNIYRSQIIRGHGTTGIISSTQAINCTFDTITFIGGRGLFVGAQNCTFDLIKYYDHNLTTTTVSTYSMNVLEFTTGSNNININDIQVPIVANGPYTALLGVNASYNITLTNVGSYASKLALNSSVTGGILYSYGNNSNITVKRCYVTGTRVGPFIVVNSDSILTLEHVYGDYADTSALPALNSIAKSCGLTGTTTGQTSVYGTHWLTRFTSTTAGFLEILCNEPTAYTTAQCYVSSGSPKFNSVGQLLATVVGQQVTWETPWWILGYTAFTNSAPTITGTNVTYSSGARWGNHDIEYQIDTGSGWNGTWKALIASNLSGETISDSTGFKIKLRVTCATASATNAITNMRIAMTTTDAAQGSNLYPLSTNTLELTGLQTGSEVRFYTGTDPATAVEIGGVESSGTTFSFSHSSGGVSGYYIIHALNYVPYRQLLTYPSVDVSYPIQQVLDRSYSNP